MVRFPFREPEFGLLDPKLTKHTICRIDVRQLPCTRAEVGQLSEQCLAIVQKADQVLPGTKHDRREIISSTFMSFKTPLNMSSVKEPNHKRKSQQQIESNLGSYITLACEGPSSLP
ncbi:hypothetical protein Ahy_A04g017067 isoform B [Arachis hypogaea]|uniref:Uncharacterized protein n=1 Tax=Arachis hypogaea TaxID=3818 RepID=A0A445D9S5_ARAHY|nr:hypothetical protein Ahy_A04g017067 isoform B [Arachis hypogaea]